MIAFILVKSQVYNMHFTKNCTLLQLTFKEFKRRCRTTLLKYASRCLLLSTAIIRTFHPLRWKNTNYELQVTSYQLRVESLKARVELEKCEFKSSILTWWVTSSNLRVTGLNLQFASSYPLVTSLNLRVEDPANTDAFKASSGRLKKVTKSFDQTKRRHNIWKWRRIYNVLKTSDLRRLEDVQFTTSWKSLIYNVVRMSDIWRLEDFCKTTFVYQRCSDFYTTSKKMLVSYFVLSEIFRKF